MSYIVVFDTNILLSALLSLQGNPFRCLALAKIGVVQSATYQEIIDEFQEKLQVKFAYSFKHARKAADEVRGFSRIVAITNTLKVIAADPDDDKILECAVVGDATHIVTGDRHLKELSSYQGISVVSAADFVKLVSVL